MCTVSENVLDEVIRITHLVALDLFKLSENIPWRYFAYGKTNDVFGRRKVELMESVCSSISTFGSGFFKDVPLKGFSDSQSFRQLVWPVVRIHQRH